MTRAVEISALSKRFARNARPALDGVNLRVLEGEMIALIGASGSGKSTLLRHIAGLVAADTGSESQVSVFGRTVQSNGRISPDARSIRCQIGVIFQQFNLVPRLRVLTNVLIGHLGKMPLWRGAFALFTQQHKREAMQALARVGIAEQALQRGATLSGGQQQRAAIARALVQQARLIVADEPIASLDPASARRVMETLRDLNRDDGITVLISLHQVEYALSFCERTVALRSGQVVYDGPSDALTPAFLADLYGEESEDLVLPSLEHRQSRERRSREPSSRDHTPGSAARRRAVSHASAGARDECVSVPSTSIA